MRLTRRNWIKAAGLFSVQLGAAAAGVRHGGGKPAPVPMPALPDSLPDRASFPEARKEVYLNSASHHPVSSGSKDLICKAVAAQCGEGDAYRPDADRVRADFAALINADTEDVTFVPSTQVGESFIATAAGLNEKGAHVVTDELHFIGSHMMYTEMQKRGLDVTWVKMQDGATRLEDIERAIIPGRTRLVAVSVTSMINGFRHDLKRLCEIAHARGAMVYADAIQAAGCTPLDVRDCGVDALCAATYKWLMSPDTAFLYVRKASRERMQHPYYHHSQYRYPGGGYLPVSHMYPYDTPADEVVDHYWPRDSADGLFSMGYAPHPATLAGLEYSLPYIMHLGVENIESHAMTLVNRLREGIAARGYPLLTPEGNVSPIISFTLRDADRLAPVFEEAHISLTTRWNHVRLAVSVFNNMEDVEKFLAVLPRNSA